jgi:hypothetical protein
VNWTVFPPAPKMFVKGELLYILDSAAVDYNIIKTYEDFRITQVSLPFLLKNKRQEVLRKNYIVEKK